MKIKFILIFIALVIISVAIIPALATDKSTFSLGEVKQYLSNSTSEVQSGYYDHQFLTSTATNLTAANIKNGVVMFGVLGTCGNDGTFLPTLTTSNDVTFVSTTDVTCGGNISSDNGRSVTSRGICWSTSHNPTKSDNISTEAGTGIGSFTCKASELKPPLTTFYIRAWATNANGTSYGNEVTFVSVPDAVGETYHGGIVYYIDGTGYHGLIGATADQAAGVNWSNNNNLTGANGSAIYTGRANTTTIVNNQGGGNYAAKLCNDYIVTAEGITYDDWYLPSTDELYWLYQGRALFGSNFGRWYWSSQERDWYKAYIFFFDIGISSYTDRLSGQGYSYVRAISKY